MLPTIANEEAASVSRGQQLLVPLACVHNGFQLQATQLSLLYQVLDMQLVGNVWGFDCCQGCCFHGWVGMRHAIVQLDGPVVCKDFPGLMLLLFPGLVLSAPAGTALRVVLPVELRVPDTLHRGVKHVCLVL